MMVNECSTERMTWSSAMRRQAILEYSSVHQPLNYLLCLKFRAMIKFQRFVWQHCYPIPSSNEAFILKIERETGIKWQETMPAQAKILKMNIFNKDNIRFVCWWLRVGCHFNTCVLYLHKTAHAFYTRWQPYTIRSNNKIRSPTEKTDRNGNSKGWITRRGKKEENKPTRCELNCEMESRTTNVDDDVHLPLNFKPLSLLMICRSAGVSFHIIAFVRKLSNNLSFSEAAFNSWKTWAQTKKRVSTMCQHTHREIEIDTEINSACIEMWKTVRDRNSK